MNNGEIKSCRIDTGDWIGSAWGSSPEWSPYAEAIAETYEDQKPWYLTTTITAPAFALGNPQFRVITTRPYQHDVLIMGMSAFAADTTGLNFLSIQIVHQETGIPWVSPSGIGFAPLLAFAGLNLNQTPILKLPEAFFLPKHSQLRLSWTQARDSAIAPVTATITFVGVQLMNPRQGSAPEKIMMPNGDEIPVGSRVPWFGCVPFGRRGDIRRDFGNFFLPNGQQAAQFLPASDCSVEVHDAYANFLNGNTVWNGDPRFLALKLSDTRARSDWTPGMQPVSAILGNETQVYPALPFPAPHLLETGKRMSLVEQNNDLAESIFFGSVTFRGVRLCKY